jgi:nicotinate-nucleotide adenylyltransferase
MKIGILGGTFNPVHLGHLILAEEARESLGLDKIVFVPANIPPHKEGAEIAAGGARLKMLKAAIKGNKRLAVSDIELKRPGRSYTIDTIKALKSKYPGDELYFIIGSDLLTYLEEWKDLFQIIKIVRFVVATRPGYALESLPQYLTRLKIRAVDISGFEVRRCIKEGKSFRYLVPEAVYNYINKNNLYR